LSLLAAFGAGYRVHLAWGALATSLPLRGLAPSLSAIHATPGLVEQPFLLIELLLPDAENEFLTALAALQRLVLQHRSSLCPHPECAVPGP